MQILSLDNVSITYGPVLAVKEANLIINSGDYICMVGPNGSGKSSLIKGILGLVPIVGGNIVFDLPKDKVAYLPQINMAARDFPAIVKEIVLLGTQKKSNKLPFYSKIDHKAAEESMEILHIEGLKNKRIGELSGGQQQRVLLARALCRKPDMLILDEPCSGLDPEITREFYGLLLELNVQNNMTILMSSHDMHQVRAHAKRVIEVDQKIVFDGSVDEWLLSSDKEGLKP